MIKKNYKEFIDVITFEFDTEKRIVLFEKAPFKALLYNKRFVFVRPLNENDVIKYKYQRNRNTIKLYIVIDIIPNNINVDNFYTDIGSWVEEDNLKFFLNNGEKIVTL